MVSQTIIDIQLIKRFFSCRKFLLKLLVLLKLFFRQKRKNYFLNISLNKVLFLSLIDYQMKDHILISIHNKLYLLNNKKLIYGITNNY